MRPAAPLAALLLLAPQFPPPAPPAHTPPAATQPAPFQPGLEIDWQARSVRAHARVVLRSGPIEFLACRPGKEHESILLLQPSATHLFMALGLLGLTPGRPPRWDDHARRPIPASGDLLDLTLEWSADGTTRRAHAFDWLLDAEFARVPIPRPMVFAGSIVAPDATLAADRTGAVVALVDVGEGLITLSRAHSDRAAELWALCNTPAIPPEGTAVVLVIAPAAPAPLTVTLDRRGDLLVNDRFATLADAADLIDLQRRLRPDAVQPITVLSPFRADLHRVRAAFAAAGLDPAAVRFDHPATQPAATQPAHR